MEPSLWMVSVVGFSAVMVLLSVLGLIIHLLSALFPERTNDSDAAVLAAINAAAAAAHPGTRVTAVEEIQ